ncbi:hypothetical protein OIU80_18600 [Flavobacterium sp. LS1R47]|jgi:hypothetical protein|uniref:Uncharacterized protein n=1 Tax=Flavobacterium frigoritolerans TaxID=2987686 RepID=A0A9X3C9Z1_9FLAO|nr:hypothetical protein [Flavobacterium frigoritolerans]MCV9934293.1 hypothetical protein [Flavobacterium frigoritolerans]
MKPIKFIYVILLSLLTFHGSVEYYKYPSELSNCQIQDIFLASDIPQVDSSSLYMTDTEMHFIIKKKVKNRAANSETSILKKSYYTKLFDFKVLKENIIYSIATIYEDQRHAHLHLYQLF